MFRILLLHFLIIGELRYELCAVVDVNKMDWPEVCMMEKEHYIVTYVLLMECSGFYSEDQNNHLGTGTGGWRVWPHVFWKPIIKKKIHKENKF